jgi:hypothetical protein
MFVPPPDDLSLAGVNHVYRNYTVSILPLADRHGKPSSHLSLICRHHVLYERMSPRDLPEGVCAGVSLRILFLTSRTHSHG